MSERERQKALETFTEYFVKNYPGPNTIISDPKWHAPKIFRAAEYAWQAALADRPEQPVAHEPVGMVVDNEAALFDRFKGKLGNDTLLYAAPVARPEPLEQWQDDELADSPTPRAQEGTWTLTAPDGRTWKADSPLRCAAAETNDRVPADVQLARIARSIADDRPEPAQPVALPWASIESAPREGTLLLAKIVGNPEHRTALWWAVTGHWSTKWGNWNDGVEPSGLAGPTHWLPINAHGVGAAPPSHPAPSEAAHELDWTKCPRCAIAVYVKKDPQCPRCGWDTREAINGNV